MQKLSSMSPLQIYCCHRLSNMYVDMNFHDESNKWEVLVAHRTSRLGEVHTAFASSCLTNVAIHQHREHSWCYGAIGNSSGFIKAGLVIWHFGHFLGGPIQFHLYTLSVCIYLFSNGQQLAHK